MATMPWNEQDRLNLLSAIGKPAMAPMQQVRPSVMDNVGMASYPAGLKGEITPATATTRQAAAPAAKKGMWDNFLGGALADPDKRARIAMALEGMTLNPNQALIDSLKSGVERRAGDSTRNKTAEWLRGQNREDLASAVMQGVITGSDAFTAIQSGTSTKAPTVTKIVTEDGSEVAVQWDKEAGQWVPLQAPEGAIPARKPLTESQSQKTMFGTIQTTTGPVIDQFETFFDPTNIADAAARSVPIAGNFFQSSEGQMYTAAAEAWAEGALRLATGAAATPAEKESVKKTYFAAVGDTPATVEFKRQLRKMYENSLSAALGKPTDFKLQIPQNFEKDVSVDNGTKMPSRSDAANLLLGL